MCQKETYLSNRAFYVSSILNKLAEIINNDEQLGEIIEATLEMSAVTNLKAFDTPKKVTVGTRNFDKYAVNGNGRYGKARMVEAVVNTYVQLHPEVTFEQLKEVFPDKFLKGWGILRPGTEIIKDPKRFYKSALANGETFYICNQWDKQADILMDYVNNELKGIRITKVE